MSHPKDYLLHVDNEERWEAKLYAGNEYLATIRANSQQHLNAKIASIRAELFCETATMHINSKFAGTVEVAA